MGNYKEGCIGRVKEFMQPSEVGNLVLIDSPDVMASFLVEA